MGNAVALMVLSGALLLLVTSVFLEPMLYLSGAVGKLSMVFLSSVIGIALGCQPILGFNLGARQYGRVKETYLTAVRYGTIIAVAAFLALQLFPKQIISIFNSDNPLFYEFAAKYIHIYFAMLFLNGIQPITSNFCTAIGKANLGFWMAVIRQGVLLIPFVAGIEMKYLTEMQKEFI